MHGGRDKIDAPSPLDVSTRPLALMSHRTQDVGAWLCFAFGNHSSEGDEARKCLRIQFHASGFRA